MAYNVDRFNMHTGLLNNFSQDLGLEHNSLEYQLQCWEALMAFSKYQDNLFLDVEMKTVEGCLICIHYEQNINKKLRLLYQDD